MQATAKHPSLGLEFEISKPLDQLPLPKRARADKVNHGARWAVGQDRADRRQDQKIFGETNLRRAFESFQKVEAGFFSAGIRAQAMKLMGLI